MPMPISLLTNEYFSLIWTGVTVGRMYKSTDYGVTWTIVTDLSGNINTNLNTNFNINNNSHKIFNFANKNQNSRW